MNWAKKSDLVLGNNEWFVNVINFFQLGKINQILGKICGKKICHLDEKHESKTFWEKNTLKKNRTIIN